MKLNLDDIQYGVEFVSSDFGDNEAYIDIESGDVYFVGDVVDEPPPSDLYESDKHVHLPRKADLDLGKPLAMSFIASALPDKLDEAYSIFSKKGAYLKFKSMLGSADMLEGWYA